MPRGPLAPVPRKLTELPRWLAWRYGKLLKNGKRKKVPVCALRGHPLWGRGCDGTCPDNWASVEEAFELVARGLVDGVGFAVTASDDILFVDLDDCVDVETGKLAPWAAEIAEGFRGAYIELSPSKSGLHVVCRGRIPAGFRQGKRGDVEVYAEGQFATVTGRVLDAPGAVVEKQEVLENLLERYGFQNKNGAKPRHGREASMMPDKAKSRGAGRSPDPGKPLPEDAEVIEAVRRTALGKRLYVRGDRSGYASPSEADMALAGLIARLAPAGGDRAVSQVVRVFRGSALSGDLARKHNEEYYLRRTARTALDNRDAYAPGSAATGEDVRRACEPLILRAVSMAWVGKAGPSDFAVILSLLLEARRRGRLVGDEVRVRLATREHALLAGLARRQTVRDSIARLEGDGWLRRLPRASGWDAQRYAIPTRGGARTGRAEADTCPHQTEHSGVGGVYPIGSRTCHLLGLACRFRGPSAVRPDSRPLRPLTKLHALVLAKVLTAGTVATGELARTTGRRENSLKSRHVADLVAAGLLDEAGDDTYAAPGDAESRLVRELEATGVLDAERAQRERYEREREARERNYTDWRYGPPPPDEDEAAAATLEHLRLQGEAELAAGPYPVTDEPSPPGRDEAMPSVPEGERPRSRVPPPEPPSRLTPGERVALDAILAYERYNGAGSFRWDRASCKRMFYGGPVRGCWPSPEELARIRAYARAQGRTLARSAVEDPPGSIGDSRATERAPEQRRLVGEIAGPVKALYRDRDRGCP